jgi:hypothetical protein
MTYLNTGSLRLLDIQTWWTSKKRQDDGIRISDPLPPDEMRRLAETSPHLLDDIGVRHVVEKRLGLRGEERHLPALRG